MSFLFVILCLHRSCSKKVSVIVDKKVHTAVNPADAWTKTPPAERIRELCRLACVFLCHSEDAMGCRSRVLVSVSDGWNGTPSR